MTTSQFSDTVVVVTGAAGGLGRAISQTFAAGGAQVVMVDHPRSDVMAVAADLGSDVIGVDVDLTTDDAPAEVIVAATKAFGAVHVLVNNAGVNRMASLLKTSDADFDTVLDINLRALFRLTRATVDAMRPQGHDPRHAIVNVASVNGLGAYSGAHAYSASKAGVIGFTRSSARELGRYGIRVNAVAPGLIRTAMTHNPDGSAQDWVGDQVQGIPLRRIGEPDDVARVVAFLASPAAGYISAQVIKIDGGGLPEM